MEGLYVGVGGILLVNVLVLGDCTERLWYKFALGRGL